MNVVGTEHILLGLIGKGFGVPAKVLKSKGLNLKKARDEVVKITGKGGGFIPIEIPFTPRAKRVLDLSLEEARKLDHNYIGCEHLLLGLLSEGEGVAARVFDNLGVDLNEIRKETINMVGQKKETVKKESSMPTLKEYGTNFDREGKRDDSGWPKTVVGRALAVDEVEDVLWKEE